VGIFGPELMLCAAAIRVGLVRQAFWAVWDREEQRLYERTRLGRGRLEFGHGRLQVDEPDLRLDVRLAETDGIETVCPSGDSYAWTRKQGGIDAEGTVELAGQTRRLAARAIIDDTAAYYPRHTTWRWSAGVGTTLDGHAVAWNLVEGVNDPPRDSERTIWFDGAPAQEPPPSRFAADLKSVDDLRFAAEATRERNENRLLLRSRYRQPFGTFSGRLPGGLELGEGYGVMEEHDVYW
jgi:hypothetical protein